MSYTPPSLKHQIDCLFRTARCEYFQTGMDSVFTMRLQSHYNSNPLAVFKLLKQKLDDPSEDYAVLAEMLNWVSFQEDPSIQSKAIELLETGLLHESALIRDTSATGLSWIQGIDSIESIRSAIDREANLELKKDMENLILSLETK